MLRSHRILPCCAHTVRVMPCTAAGTGGLSPASVLLRNSASTDNAATSLPAPGTPPSAAAASGSDLYQLGDPTDPGGLAGKA